MRKAIDLNCDVGETCAELDARLLRLVSSCNISCGAHAGDIDLITSTVRQAIEQGVAIGAHPAYPDRENCGRISMSMDVDDLRQEMHGQCDLLRGIVRSYGGKLHHIKPHGALYHDLARQPKLAKEVFSGVVQAFPQCAIYGMAGSELSGVCQQLGLRFVAEGFADRAYASAIDLVPRSQPGALMELPSQFEEHLKRLLDGEICDLHQCTHQVSIDTICFHSDTPSAVALIERALTILKAADVRLAPPSV